MDYDELNLQAFMDLSDEGKLMVMKHYGTKYHSGRYPYGSGKDPYQRTRTESDIFNAARSHFRDKGLNDEEIRNKFGMTTTQWRDMVTRVKAEEKQRIYKEVQTRIERGESRQSISEKLGISLSSVDNYVNMDASKVNSKKSLDNLSNTLKSKVDEVKYLDISEGVESQLGIAQTKLRSTVSSLVATGDYKVERIFVEQVTNQGSYTEVKVLVKSDVDRAFLLKNKHLIRPVDFYYDKNNSNSIQNLQTPKSIDLKRVKIKYAIPEGQPGHGTEEDGAMMDGCMYIRPGVKDLSLGKAHYAQVRIAVNDSHYLKGMAIYGDEKDFPKGVDIIFNTNKKKGVPALSDDPDAKQVLKPLKEKLNGLNPFGATLKKQAPMLDKDGNPVVNEKLSAKAKKLGYKTPVYENGAINIVNEEGDWLDWDKTLSSQFLSKQPNSVVKERLNATLKKVDKEYDQIQKIDNPVIRKKLLENYVGSLESKQVHLKAAAPSSFQAHVLLPIPNMKENEVYAPNYNDGDRLILIRYPHAGRFEIPELIVNNKGPGKKVIGNKSKDAIGIHPKVASKMSGADFDGDTAYLMLNNSGKFKTAKSLKGLKDFDPGIYADEKGTFKPMKKSSVQGQMGSISNLITDMSMKNASPDEMTRAVKHSMVVIDAYKHKLNYQRSEEENGIPALKKKYQGHVDNVDYSKLERYNPRTRKLEKAILPSEINKTGRYGEGGATVLSRHAKEVHVGGTEVIVPTPDGKTKKVIRNPRKAYVTNMLKDASAYLNPDSTPVEHSYVNYINELKKRKDLVDKEIPSIKMPKQDKRASIIYKDEVDSLKEKLRESLANAPKERMAQVIAQNEVAKIVESRGGYKELENGELKKFRNQAITGARLKVGAKRRPVDITSDEWDAIQANAISPSMLSKLTRHMDDDQLIELAMPKQSNILSPNKKAKAIAMLNNGYTNAEVANLLGVSPSTISKIKSQD